METQTELRAEVARLREDVDHLLEMLRKTDYRTSARPRRRLELDAEHLQIRAQEDGHLPIEVTTSEDESGFFLNDRKGCRRGSFSISDSGALLELRNAEGQVVVSLGEPGGRGQIYVADETGIPCASLKSTKLGVVVSALHPTGQQAAYLLAEKTAARSRS